MTEDYVLLPCVLISQVLLPSMLKIHLLPPCLLKAHVLLPCVHISHVLHLSLLKVHVLVQCLLKAHASLSQSGELPIKQGDHLRLRELPAALLKYMHYKYAPLVLRPTWII